MANGAPCFGSRPKVIDGRSNLTVNGFGHVGKRAERRGHGRPPNGYAPWALIVEANVTGLHHILRAHLDAVRLALYHATSPTWAEPYCAEVSICQL